MVSCLVEVYVQRWVVWPLQSHSWAWVPLAVVAPLMSTHRPDCPPTIITFCCVPLPVPGGSRVIVEVSPATVCDTLIVVALFDSVTTLSRTVTGPLTAPPLLFGMFCTT